VKVILNIQFGTDRLVSYCTHLHGDIFSFLNKQNSLSVIHMTIYCIPLWWIVLEMDFCFHIDNWRKPIKLFLFHFCTMHVSYDHLSILYGTIDVL